MKIVSDDVWVQADLMVKRFGETAPDAVALEADRLHQAGNTESEQTWLRVIPATKAVLARDVATA